MTRLLFATPGDLSLHTGGYHYDRRVLAELPGCGVEVTHCPLSGSFPDPLQLHVAEAVEAINGGLRPNDAVLIDGLAFGALPEAAVRTIEAPIIALCHHPLGLETGLTPARSRALLDSERKALALAAHVIATSATTGFVLARDFAVPANRISVALPGTDNAARATGSSGPPILLAVGALIPRKGYHLLIEALADIADLDWHLRLAGSPAHAPVTATELMHSIDMKGLGGRVTCLGDLSAGELARAYATSDIFVSSSFYEGYGMALAEAMARGLPIVTTTGGAAADTVPNAAGLKVPPGDVAGLREALRRLIEDKELRLRLADASRHAGQQLPNWRDTTMVIAKAAQNLVLALP